MTDTLEKIKSDFDLSEIINGEEVMSPSPFINHQKIVSKIFLEISKFLEKNNLGGIYISPLDVIFEKDFNRLQPDLIFISKENSEILQDWIRGVPDMVVEVISKSSFKYDTVIKKDIYEKYGVNEFWLVIPDMEVIEVFVLEDAKYKLFSSAEGQGAVKSKVLSGFEFDIAKILK